MWTNIPKPYLWTIQILNHVAFATNMFERLVLPVCKFGSRTVGCCEHVASVLRYPSYQRNQTGEVLSETNYCGTVNVLDAADTNWDSNWGRVNTSKSLYARRLSDFLYKLSVKVHQHLFHYFPKNDLIETPPYSLQFFLSQMHKNVRFASKSMTWHDV